MRRLISNVVHNLWGQVTTLSAALIAAGFVARRLGPDALGIIYFSSMLSGALFSSLALGVCEMTVREVASHGRTDPGYTRDLIRTASLLYWLSYGVLALAAWLLAPWLVRNWIRLGVLAPEPAITAVRVMTLGGLLALPRALYRSVLCGFELMAATNAIDALAAVFQQLGVVAVILGGYGLVAVAGWWAAAIVLWTGAYLLAAAMVLPAAAVLPGLVPYVLRRNMRFSLHMALVSALGFLHTEADRIIVSKLMPINVLGYYGVAGRITRRAGTVTSAVSQAALPSFSALVETDRPRALRQYHCLQDLVCYGTLPLFALLPFLTPPLFTLLFDRGTASTLLLPMALLALGQYMSTTMTIPFVFSLAVGKPDIASRQNILATVSSLPIAILLISRLGLTGAGLSWVTYQILAYGYGVPRICRDCLGIRPRQWAWHIAKVSAVAAFTYGFSWVIAYWGGEPSTGALIRAFTIGTILYIPAAYLASGQDLRGRIAFAVSWRRCRPSRSAIVSSTRNGR